MPLVEVGPGYVSPTSGGYAAPGATAPAPIAAPATPVLPRDNFNGLANPSAPILAPAAPAPAGAPIQAKSFFSNLWDQFIGPVVKGVWNFISGLFGGRSASVPA